MSEVRPSGLPRAGRAVSPPPPPDEPPQSGHPANQMVRMASALLSAQAATWIVTILGLLVVPRYLGSHDFGVLATAYTVGMFGLAIASLGTTNYLVKEIARHPEHAAQIMASALALRLAAWAALAAVVIPGAMAVVDNDAIRMAIIVTFIGTAFDLLKTGAMAGLQARYALGATAIGQGLIALVGQLIIVALLVMGYRLTGVVLTLFAGSVLAALLTVFVFWRRFGLRAPLADGGMRTVLTASSIYIGWDIALIIAERVDVLMLAFLAGATATGQYAFALRLTAIPSFVHSILAGTIFPSLAARGALRPEAFRSILDGAMRILIVATVPMGVGLALLAPEITRLVGGGDFADAWPIVVVMALVWPLIGIDTVLGTALFAADKQRAWVMVAWAAAVINPLLNFATIPLAARLWDNPGIGAALSTAATEVWMGLCAWYFLRGYVSPRATLRVAGLTLLACFLMTPAVILARDLGGLAFAVPVGALTYGGAAVALKLVTTDDVRFLRNSWGNRGTPAPTHEVAEAAS